MIVMNVNNETSSRRPGVPPWLGIAMLALALAGCGLFMTPERRVARAEKFMNDGDYGSALIELRNALDEQPEHVRGRVMLARAELHEGDLAGADKDLARAKELGAPGKDTALLEAEVKLSLGDTGALEKLAQQADSGLAEHERLTYLGYAQLRSNRVDDALGSFRAAVAAAPEGEGRLRARTGLAEALAQSGDFAAAIAELDAVIRVDADYLEARLSKGMLLVQRGEAAKSEEVLAALPLSEARSPLARMHRVAGLASLFEAQLAQNKVEDAAKTLKHFRSTTRALLGSYLAGRLAFARGDPGAAVIELQKVVSGNPKWTPARFLLAQSLANAGNLSQAEAELQTVVQAEPDNVEARKLLADVQIRTGRPSAAVQSLSPAMQAGAEDAQLYSIFGRARFEQGDRAGARESWERSLETNPDDPKVKLDVARSYIAAGDTRRALELLASVPDDVGGTEKRMLQLMAMAAGKDRAVAKEEVAALVRRNPDDIRLMGLAGAWLLSQDDMLGARAYVDQALAKKADDVPTLLLLARMDLLRKDATAARKSLMRVLDAEPKNGLALKTLSQISASQGDQAGARQWLEEWAKRDPKAAEPRLMLAHGALRTGDPELGTRLIDEAVAADPRAADVAYGAGQVLMEAGRYDDALRRFRAALEASPNVPEIWLAAARAQLALNQRQSARESLGKALSLRTHWTPAVLMLAQMDARDGRTQAAIAAADQLKRAPETAALGFALEGDVRMAARDFPAADKAYAEAYRRAASLESAQGQFMARRAGKLASPDEPLVAWLDRNPADARGRFLLAEYRQAEGNLKAAIVEYERLLQASPDSPIVLNNLAWLYQQTADSRAEPTAKKAYDAASGNWAIADTYGWILVGAGRAREAIPILKDALAKSNNSAEVLYHLGTAHARAGEAKEARATLTTAVANAGDASWKTEAEKLLAETK